MSYLTRRGANRNWVAVAALSAAAVTFVACGSDTAEPALGDELTAATVDDRLLDADGFAKYVESSESILVVNVHVPYDGHLADTDAFIPFDTIAESEELPADRSTPIAVYCRSGAMSATATATLYGVGFTNVVDLDGGMNAWTESGRILIDDPAAVS